MRNYALIICVVFAGAVPPSSTTDVESRRVDFSARRQRWRRRHRFPSISGLPANLVMYSSVGRTYRSHRFLQFSGRRGESFHIATQSDWPRDDQCLHEREESSLGLNSQRPDSWPAIAKKNRLPFSRRQTTCEQDAQTLYHVALRAEVCMGMGIPIPMGFPWEWE